MRIANWSLTGLAISSDFGLSTSLGFSTSSAFGREGFGGSTGSSRSARNNAQPVLSRHKRTISVRRIRDLFDNVPESGPRHDLTGKEEAPESPQGDGRHVRYVTARRASSLSLHRVEEFRIGLGVFHLV